MAYEFLESEYSKERKRSDHRLRQVESVKQEKTEEGGKRDEEKEEKLRHPLAGYETSEQERRDKKVPREKLQMRGGKQRLSAGYEEDGTLLMVFSRDKNDGEVKDQETVKREGSSTMKEDKKYLRSGTHAPEKSAVFLEDREQKRKQFLMERLEKTIQVPGEMLIGESFPFLSEKEEKMEIKVLEDEARAHSLDRETAERNRKRADVLRKDLTAKEQERRDLLQRLISQVTPEEKKKSGSMPWLWLDALILDSVVSSGDDAEDSDAPENDAGQKDSAGQADDSSQNEDNAGQKVRAGQKDNAGQKNRTRKKRHAGQKVLSDC